MVYLKRTIAVLLFICLLVSCAGSDDIFPDVVLSADEASASLPNPISMAVDVANSQIIVANSNVDILYETGSLAVLSFDATDTDAPILTTSTFVSSPNFSGEIVYDGAGSLYVPFREVSDADEDLDKFNKYTVTAGALDVSISGTVASDPFGLALSGASLYVVSDDVLEIYDTDLTLLSQVDLTTADDAEIDDTLSEDVQGVAVDVTGNRAFVSNNGGDVFVVDLATNTLVQAIAGPASTRNILVDGNSLYVLDAYAEAVWIFNLDNLSAPSSTPEETDDSYFLVTTISVGNNPMGMALDTTHNRLYVSNMDDDTISVIDTVSQQEITQISIDEDFISEGFLRDGESPIALALGEFNGVTYLFVAGFTSNSIVVINTESLGVVEIYPNTEAEDLNL